MSGTAIAKTAVIAVQNKDKIGKAALAAAVGLILPFMLILTSFFSLVTSFLPDGILMDSNTYDVTKTAIYKETKPVIDNYMDDVKKKIERRKEKLVKQNTKVTTEKDANGREVRIKKCELKINKKYDRSIAPCLIAYLQGMKKIETKTGKIDREAAEEFLRETGRIKVKKISEKEYDIYNTYFTPEKISQKYFETETEKSRYIATSSAYKSFFKNEVAIATENIKINEIQNINVNLLEMPLYLQYVAPWGSVPYGRGTISGYGCCPTCLAMVLSYMKKQAILPSDIVAWTGNRYYVPGAGSSWDIFPAVAQHWGVSCTNLGHNTQAMTEALQKGKPVIASMSPGTFTRGGHFIVLTGITKDSKIKVNDPNDNASKNFKNREFDLSLITRESKNYWSFE